MALDKKAFVKIYASVWLAVALVTLGWLIVEAIQFDQCCRGKVTDMGIGLAQLFYGTPAIIVAVSAFVLLIAKHDVLRLLTLVLIGLVTTLFFLSAPMLSLVSLAAVIFAIYCAHAAKPKAPR